MSERRLQDLIRFYSILNELEETIGARALADCRGRMKWPARGVYFFREAGGSTTLWGRLSTHRGQVRSGGGNHRGSIFRLIVGTALIGRDGHEFPTWGEGGSAAKDIKAGEIELERAVSEVVRAMPFIWLSMTNRAPSACAEKSKETRSRC